MSQRIFIKTLFENKLYKSNANEFEHFFQEVMSMKHGSTFTPVEVYGNIGDRKNDGYFHSIGVFYQVYGPEDYTKETTQTTAINKFKKDFEKLMDHISDGNWQSINKYIYVINTKKVKLDPNLSKERDELSKKYSTVDIEVYTDKNLYYDFLGLALPYQEEIIGCEIPDNPNYDLLNFEVLKEAIDYLLKLDPMLASQEKLVAPIFEEKIKFNNLSDKYATLLNRYVEHYDDLIEYFEVENPDLKEDIRAILNSLYEEAKQIDSDVDNQFFYIYTNAIDRSKRKDSNLQKSMLSLMSYFFSTCDIFEAPK
jgi:hypothetical protein